MPDYKSMYYMLAAQVADAIDLLIKAQKDGENSVMDDNCISLESEETMDEHGNKPNRA